MGMRRAVAIGLAAVAVLPRPAAAEPPLTMTCHLLRHGVPSADPTTFVLLGDDLFARSAAGNVRISAAGAPLALGTSRDDGVVTQTFADHTRNDRVVTRRVYWKQGVAPRRLRFSERYDFAAQTLTVSGEAKDICHHQG